jgi:hypothetical protein
VFRASFPTPRIEVPMTGQTANCKLQTASCKRGWKSRPILSNGSVSISPDLD